MSGVVVALIYSNESGRMRQPQVLERKYLTELGACTFHPFRLVGVGVNLPMRSDREEKEPT